MSFNKNKKRLSFSSKSLMSFIPEQFKASNKKGYLDMASRHQRAGTADRKPIEMPETHGSRTSVNSITSSTPNKSTNSAPRTPLNTTPASLRGIQPGKGENNPIGNTVTNNPSDSRNSKYVTSMFDESLDLESSVKSLAINNSPPTPVSQHNINTQPDQKAPFLTLDLDTSNDLRTLIKPIEHPESQQNTIAETQSLDFTQDISLHTAQEQQDTDLFEEDEQSEEEEELQEEPHMNFTINKPDLQSVKIDDREVLINHGVYIFDPAIDTSRQSLLADEFFNPFSPNPNTFADQIRG